MLVVRLKLNAALNFYHLLIMQVKLKRQVIKLTIFHLIICSVVSISSYSQQRRDEEMPEIIQPVKSINNFTGWRKDNIGKWFQFNSFRLGEQVLSIDISEIEYDGKKYLCLATFIKSFYIKANIKHIEYSADFWVFDQNKMQSLKYTDTAVFTRIYQNIIISSIVNYKPITWSEILIRIKECFIGTYPNSFDTSYQTRKTLKELYNNNDIYPSDMDASFDPYENFFIKYRYDYKSNKAQFYLGTLMDDLLSIDEKGKSHWDFRFNDSFLGMGGCNDKDKNRNLECCYFEAPKSLFEATFKQIIE